MPALQLTVYWPSMVLMIKICWLELLSCVRCDLQDDFEEFETPDDIYEPILDQLENVADTSVSKSFASNLLLIQKHRTGLHASFDHGASERESWSHQVWGGTCGKRLVLLRLQLAVPSHVAVGPAAKDKEKEKEKDRERAAALAAKAQLAAHGQIRCGTVHMLRPAVAASCRHTGEVASCSEIGREPDFSHCPEQCLSMLKICMLCRLDEEEKKVTGRPSGSGGASRPASASVTVPGT
jgi:hypothetical protein